MFTGLVEEVGRVSSIGEGEMLRLGISAGRVSEGVRAGDSVCVNGVCLTVGEADGRDARLLRHARDVEAHGARGPHRRESRQPGAGDVRGEQVRGTHRAGSRRRRRRGARGEAGRRRGDLGVRGPRGRATLLRREGQYLRRRYKPDDSLRSARTHSPSRYCPRPARTRTCGNSKRGAG